ncbi:MAG: (2Fe-2S)-binding protein [Bacteriovoracales bacterium]|nr:(2Fe-2S)-binding protein [Bacteriovoracales bacterium]
MGTPCELDEAMEAVAEYKALDSLKLSDELVCECWPVSYRQVTQYLERPGHDGKSSADVLHALRIAQGCGTCLDKACRFIERMRRNHNVGI